VRDDGSTTWWPLPPHFAEHDLLHYAVETTLGLNHAFFGLLAGGRDIADFGTRDGQKDFYPPEAIRAEFIVGVIQSLMQDNIFPGNDATFGALEVTAEKNPNLPPLNVTGTDLDGIRAMMSDLTHKWRKLPAGEAMELPFPSDSWQTK
jgi:hypothetical protein